MNSHLTLIFILILNIIPISGTIQEQDNITEYFFLHHCYFQTNNNITLNNSIFGKITFVNIINLWINYSITILNGLKGTDLLTCGQNKITKELNDLVFIESLEQDEYVITLTESQITNSLINISTYNNQSKNIVVQNWNLSHTNFRFKLSSSYLLMVCNCKWNMVKPVMITTVVDQTLTIIDSIYLLNPLFNQISNYVLMLNVAVFMFVLGKREAIRRKRKKEKRI